MSLSVLTVLVLRGSADGRRAASPDGAHGRLRQISNDVEAELERLGGGPDPLVRRLTRRPGQKEERWAQLLH